MRTTAPAFSPLARSLAGALLASCAAGPRGVAPARDDEVRVHAPQRDPEALPVADALALGRADAPLTLLCFADLRAAYAPRWLAAVEALRARYGPDLRVALRAHPAAERGPDGLLALRVAHAAPPASDRAALLRALVAHPGALAPDAARALASPGSAALDAPAVTARLDEDLRRARGLLEASDPGPACWLNGTAVRGAPPAARYVPLADAALARAHAVVPASDAYARAVAAPLADPLGAPAPGAGFAPVRDPRARYRVPVEGALAQGSAEALVTVAVFVDPSDRATALALEARVRELRDRFDRDLRVALWPAPSARRAGSYEAAALLYEAHAQGGDAAVARVYAALLARGEPAAGDELGLEALAALAREAGLDEARARAALTAGAHTERVLAGVGLAARLGVADEPGLFVNGRHAPSGLPVERYVDLVQRALGEASPRVAAGAPRAGLYEALVAEGASALVFLPAGPDGAPLYPVDDDPSAPARGPARAPVLVAHFGDLEDPREGPRAALLSELATAHGARLRVSYRELPDRDAHPRAALAAEAAREAYAQRGLDAYLRYREALVRAPTRLERADLERLARAQRLNVQRFREALGNRVRTQDLARDRAAFEALGLGAQGARAPVTFVNGRALGPDEPVDRLREAVAAALAAHDAAAPAAPEAP